jgi:phage-related tail protein
MATNFPTSLDALTNPLSTDKLNNPSHSTQHANANDAIEALQAKVGVNSSAVTTSIDYKVAALDTRVTSAEGKVLPAGGTTGQVLAKSSGTNYATTWIDPPGDIIYFQVFS